MGEAFKLKDCQKSRYIVHVEEPFQEDGFWCIPMEYIAGTTLDKRNPLKMPEGEALRYVRQVGEALGVIHAQGLIHQDVSPDNVIRRLNNTGMNEAVLIDVGLSIARLWGAWGSRTRSLTDTGSWGSPSHSGSLKCS